MIKWQCGLAREICRKRQGKTAYASRVELPNQFGILLRKNLKILPVFAGCSPSGEQAQLVVPPHVRSTEDFTEEAKPRDCGEDVVSARIEL